MEVNLRCTRYSVDLDGEHLGVVIPRNKSEWVFVRCNTRDFEYYVAASPEAAVAQCPYVQKYLLPQSQT